MNHINAREVFPPELVKEIQKYYSGGYLWIPKPDYHERNKEIRMLYEGGKSIKHIATEFNLTEKRIRQIIRKSQTGK